MADVQDLIDNNGLGGDVPKWRAGLVLHGYQECQWAVARRSIVNEEGG